MPNIKPDEDYFPSPVLRLQTINTQLAEFEAMYYRNFLELEVETALEGNVKAMEKEVAHNTEILVVKIDTLRKLRAKLEKELEAESTEEAAG